MINSTRLQHSGRRALFVVLLLVALLVRLAGAWFARFDVDEAQCYTSALDVAEGRGIPALGPGVSATDAHTPGPFFYLFVAVPLLATPDPLAGSVFFALLGTVGVCLGCAAFARLWDETAGLIFLSLAAVSPALVTFTDRVWPADIFPPFAFLTLYALVRVLSQPRSRFVALLPFSLLVVTQAHIAFVCLAGVVAAALLVYRPRLNVPAVLAGTAFGILFYVPYLVHELSNGFANTRALASGGAAGHRDLTTLLGLFAQFFAFATTDASYLAAKGHFGGFDPFAFWGQGGVEALHSFWGGSIPASALLLLLEAAGWLLVLFGIMRLAAAANRRVALLFWAALGSILVFGLVAGRGYFAHYVLPFVPFAFITVVAAVRALVARGGAARAAALAYCVLAPVAGAFTLVCHYREDSRQSIPQQKQVVAFVNERMGARIFRFDADYPGARPQTYGVVAKRYFGYPWRVNDKAQDFFTVYARDQRAADGSVPGPATLVLDTVAVVHERAD